MTTNEDPDNCESPESELLRRAQAGNSSAFAALCQAHRQRLWRVVSSVAAASDREDLAQEAIVRAFSALKQYRGETSFPAWLCRIAVNAAHDYQKTAWRRRVVPFPDSWDDFVPGEMLETLAERREMQRRVRQAVARLPSAQRIPIWLHYFEGFSLVEIGQLENVAESTVRSRVQAGLKKLAPHLSDLMSGSENALPARSAKGCET